MSDSMREITYRQALNEALAEELERDPNVFLMGEEVAEYNGAYKVSARACSNASAPSESSTRPFSENGFAGLGVGAAMVGLRPIIEFMTFSFSFVAFDQVVNNAPNMLTMCGGQFNIPITFPRAERSGASARRDPFARDRMFVCQRPGTQGLHAGNAARRQRTFEDRGARQQSGAGA